MLMFIQWVIFGLLLEYINPSMDMYTDNCEEPDDPHIVKKIQGEGLQLSCPNSQCSSEKNLSKISWFKIGNDGLQLEVATEENERVHYHETVLYFLPLMLNDTGLYITRWKYTDKKCDDYTTDLVVYKTFHTDQLYGNYTEQPGVVPLTCPECKEQGQNLSWYKDFVLMPHKSENILQVYLSSNKDEGIYTCSCWWKHNRQIYNSSGSYQLQIKERQIPFLPIIQNPKNNSEKFIDLGSKVMLECEVFIGSNMTPYCNVFWTRNGINIYLQSWNNTDREYSFNTITENSKHYLTVTINNVSQADLESKFCCRAKSLKTWVFSCVSLKINRKALPVAVPLICALLLLLLVAGTAKWMAVDLILFLRGLRIMQNKKDDGKVYDAFVIYQSANLDNKTERRLAHFVNNVLPAVLEKDCGFNLYILGRDNLPGEDYTELIETKMRLSRRLIAVLTPGIMQDQTDTTPQSYDWQVGLHQVLVEEELSVILIQLGDMRSFSHLQLGLQYIIQKKPPLKWDERGDRATCLSSYFWKQVRYRMPAHRSGSARLINNQTSTTMLFTVSIV